MRCDKCWCNEYDLKLVTIEKDGEKTTHREATSTTHATIATCRNCGYVWIDERYKNEPTKSTNDE
jgi:hypothetical protein